MTYVQRSVTHVVRIQLIRDSRGSMALQFWKPGTQGPGSSLDRASEAEGHVIPSLSSGGQVYGIQDQRERLPIFKHCMCFVCLHPVV